MRLKSALAALVFLSAGAASSLAQATWAGIGGDTNWSTALNWGLDVVPTSGPSTTIDFTSATAFTSTVDTSFQLNMLTVSNGAGALVLNNSGGATLSILNSFMDSSANAVTVSVPLQSSMGLFVEGGGSLTLSSALNTFTGGVVVSSGTLVDGVAGAFPTASGLSVASGGTVDVNNNENVSYLYNYLGTGGSVVIGSGATLTLTNGASGAFGGIISGAGGLTYNSFSNALTLTGANSYSGTTTIDSGTLEIGSNGTTGAVGTGPIVTVVNGFIEFARSDSNTYANAISGTGGVEVLNGTAVLSGTNSYTGNTLVTNATLEAGSSAALGGTTVFSNVILSGGTLNLENFNIEVGGLTADASSSIVLGSGNLNLHNIAASNTIAGTITGTGSLTVLTGTLNLTGNSNTYSGGTTLNGGSLVINNSSSSASATGSGAITINGGGGTFLQIGSDSTSGYIANMPITDNGVVDFQRTDSISFPNAISGTGSVEAQDGGTVTLTGTNTYSGITNLSGNATFIAGTTSAFGNGTSAFSFGTGGGTLNLNNFNNTLGSITGNSGTIALGSATLTIGGVPGTTTFSGIISGTGGVDLTGPATEVTDLLGASTYSGPTLIGTGAVLGIGFNNGTTGSFASSGVSGAGTLQFNLGNSYSYAGALTGTLNVTQAGTGATTLSGTNTYSGTTKVTGGTLDAGSTSAFGGATGESAVNMTGGTLALANFSNTVGSITGTTGTSITLGTGTLTTGGANASTTFKGVISGTGLLSVVGTGTTILDGANTYSGGSSIASGATLEVGDGATTGALIVGNVADNGTLIFNPASSDNLTFAGSISGSGGLTFMGPGKITLTGTNTYTGVTDVDPGILADGGLNAFSQGSMLEVDTNGNLQVNFNETVAGLLGGGTGGTIALGTGTTLTSLGMNYVSDYPGAISGAGAIGVSSGQQGFSGNNTYTGGTVISGTGEVWVGSNTALGTGTLTFNGSDTELSPDAANVTLANAVVLDSTFDNDDGTDNLTLTGLISGAAEIEWCTWGTLALTHSNTFTGGIDMREGTLLLGSDTAAGTGGIILDTGTILAAYGGPGVTRILGNSFNITGSSAQFGNNDDNFLTLNGTFSGTSSLTYAGGSTGTLTINGANSSYSGPFTIASGTVYAGNNLAFGSNANTVNLTGGAGLNVQNGVTVNNPLSFSGTGNVISGDGTIGTVLPANTSVIIAPSASPGGGPGNLTFGNVLQLQTGATIDFRIYDANGSAGVGTDLITAVDGISLSSAAANSITFNLSSINSAGGSANALNFNSASSYSWMFATSPTIVTGFSANQFVLNTSDFTNATGTGVFSFTEVGGDSLYLNFTPVPEPSTWALMGGGLAALAGAVVLRRRRAARA